jgi:hypothetical protein
MFRIFKKEKERTKEKETKNHEKNSKTKKPEKKTNEKRKNPGCRRVNGPAQYRAHAGGAGLGPANGRSIGFALESGVFPPFPGSAPAEKCRVQDGPVL